MLNNIFDFYLENLTKLIKKYKVKYIVTLTKSPPKHWSNLEAIEAMAGKTQLIQKENLFKDQYYYIYKINYQTI